MEHLLAAVDFSDVTPRVLALASDLARATGAQLTLLHVAAPEPDFVGFDVGPESVREARAGELRAEHRELQQQAARLADDGLQARALLIQGPTVEKIAAEAERLPADLVLVGSHGRGALLRAVLGSVSEGLLRRSPCPVVVVPARAG